MKTNHGPTAKPRFSRVRVALLPFVLGLVSAGAASGQSPYQSNQDFTSHAMKLRENALMKVEPQVFVPSTAPSAPRFFSRSPWKENIITTVFWVGEQPTARNPTPNHASCWDPKWAVNYGGYDNPDPAHRRNFIPAAFTPRQNPFYIALPYNDVTRGRTKPEAYTVIPWFRQAFEREGKSVCRSRWLAIRFGTRTCYAQWEDAGPFRTDHYQYVFGNEMPRPNLNQGAGLDVSPAVRDYLGINMSKDACSWRFVEANEVPPGPWRLYGDNNTFVINARDGGTRSVQNQSSGNGIGNR